MSASAGTLEIDLPTLNLMIECKMVAALPCPAHVVLGMQSAKLYSFTNLLPLACLLTPAIAMSFLLVLMSYHEKAQDDQLLVP